VDDTRSEGARRVASNFAAEEELDAIRPPEIEVVAQDFLEEVPTLQGSVEDVGHAELELPDRQLVAIAGGPVLAGERMREASKPAPEEAIDVVGR
jgi:hypothetical protein